MRKIQLLLMILSISFHASADLKSEAKTKTYTLGVGEEAQQWEYETEADYWGFFTKMPETTVKAFDTAFSKEALVPWAWIAASTGLLYAYDDRILEDVQRQGRDLGLGNDDNTKTYIRIGDLPIFRGPSDLGSALYYLGDGWLHSFIVFGFFGYGQFNENGRALQTSMQLAHAMAVSTVFSQLLKRSFGRESPFRRTTARGKFRPFPSFNAYNENVSRFDAMPSGHVMTLMTTITVLKNNYPEYGGWIKGVGYTALGLLGWQMVNNGVHWASDYPLGIAMGVLFGNIASGYWRKPVGEGGQNKERVHWMPMLEPGTLGVQALYRF